MNIFRPLKMTSHFIKDHNSWVTLIILEIQRLPYPNITKTNFSILFGVFSNFFIFESIKFCTKFQILRIVLEEFSTAFSTSFNPFKKWNLNPTHNRINSFVLNTPFLYPLKTSENLTVFWCFQGVEKECFRNKRVNLRFMN